MMKRLLLFLCCLPASVLAMDDDMFFHYTRAELGAGRALQPSAAVQSVLLDGWVGGDKDRLWWQADAQWQGGPAAHGLGAWYGHYFAPFWDAQAGVRSEGGTDYLSIGARGLAPYQYDSDIKLELGGGKWFAHGSFEQEVLLTNRFILRPSLALSLSASDIDNTVRRGIYRGVLGLQARYEFSRELAPFLSLTRTLHPRALPGGEPHVTQWLVGVRLIF